MEKISVALIERCGLNKGEKLLLGVSGGPDSLVLLDILSRLDYSMVIAHFNHQLRPESVQEAAFVEEQATLKGFEFLLGSEDTAIYARTQKLTIEEAARELRYRFLFEQAKRHGITAVLVGHTADDQVETVLMHLIRGAGLDGLVGLQYRTYTEWSAEIPLVRPLVGVWREEVLKYCMENNLEPQFDESNLDTTYFRNRLRHELIPTLEDYNPQIKHSILKMSETLSADRVLLDQLVENFIDNSTVEVSREHIALERDAFKKAPLGLQRRVLRKIISLLRPGLRDIGFEAVEHALQSVLRPPQSGQVDLISGLRLVIERDCFILSDWGTDITSPEWPQLQPGVSLKFTVPGELSLSKEWTLAAVILEGDVLEQESVFTNENPFVAYLDQAEVGQSFLVRGRNAGDRFSPLGMQGNSMKLSDFMVNVKLPRRGRKNWPLVFSGDQLVWVPGYRISHWARVREGTKGILRISLAKRRI